jgi:transposase InsO family protein
MVWKETCAMEERMRFVDAVVDDEETFAALCRRFGVSRKTGYKWLERYDDEGVEGLKDRSRAPLHHPQAMPDRIAEQCVAVRRAHPTWGPVKVLGWLENHRPRTRWPTASTIGDLFDREGLTVKRRLRRRGPPSSAPFAPCTAANDTWCIDFKGWFRTGDGARCEPLTLSDAHSRYLLRCQALARTDTEHVWPVLDAAFREFGLPLRLRSDNGPPFASCGAGGLSQFAVKVIKAGAVPERIAPGKPQQNGRLERLHLTLLQDTANPPAHSLREQLKRLRRFQRLYNRASEHPSCYVIEEKRLCWPECDTVGYLGFCRARSVIDRAGDVVSAVRAKIHGPSGRGWIASISPASAASRSVLGAICRSFAALLRLSHGSIPSSAGLNTGMR